MPRGRRAPIYGLLGIADTYLRYKEGQREEERIAAGIEDLREKGRLAQQTFEAEYGTGDKPGLHERRLKQRRIESGDKAFLYTPIAKKELDEKVKSISDFDKQAGTNLSGALSWGISGIQSRVDKGEPRISIARSFHAAVTNPANVENMIRRLDLAKAKGDSEANESIEMMKQALKQGTFSDIFFPQAMAKIREEESVRASREPKWGETEKGVRYKEDEATKRTGIAARPHFRETEKGVRYLAGEEMKRAKLGGRATKKTGGLTDLQKAEAVRKIREEFEGTYYDKDGKPRAPSIDEVVNAQRYAAQYGYTAKITEVVPGEYSFQIVPLEANKQPGGKGAGLKVTGGTEAPTKEEALEELKRRGVSL